MGAGAHGQAAVSPWAGRQQGKAQARRRAHLPAASSRRKAIRRRRPGGSPADWAAATGPMSEQKKLDAVDRALSVKGAIFSDPSGAGRRPPAGDTGRLRSSSARDCIKRRLHAAETCASGYSSRRLPPSPRPGSLREAGRRESFTQQQATR